MAFGINKVFDWLVEGMGIEGLNEKVDENGYYTGKDDYSDFYTDEELAEMNEKRIEEERLQLVREAEEEYFLEKAEKLALIREALGEQNLKKSKAGSSVRAVNCPSCGASFKGIGNMSVCPYCESVIVIE